MNSNLKMIDKSPNKDFKSMIEKWVSTTIPNTAALWEIPISKASNEVGFNVSINYLRAKFSCSEAVANKYRYLTLPLIDKMIETEILVDLNEGEYIAAIEYRRKLLNWYRKLSIDSKKQLPIFGNKILFSKLPLDENPLRKKALEFKLVKDTVNLIHKDLMKLGILNTEYKTIAEKEFDRKSKPIIPTETRTQKFERLANLNLKHVRDFVTPTEAEPFIQVEQIFACQIKTLSEKSTINNYMNACKNFIKFLIKLYGNVPLFIVKTFDEHLLSKFRQYLQQQLIQKKISSHYAASISSAVRKTLIRLAMIDGISYRFFDIEGFDTTRQTDIKQPFSKNERLQLFNAIEEGLVESRKSLLSYKKQFSGENPLDGKENIKKGFSTLENARWLFENRLNCQAVYYSPNNTKTEKKFLKIIQILGLKLHEVYNDWGVNPIITSDITLPYLLKLAQITGLNLNSLLELDIDDYVECHPATLKPCLRYWKERSDGYKEYHLDLFKAELTWLTSKQATSVKMIFEELIEITKLIRPKIKDEHLINRLFIYQSKSTVLNGRVSPIARKNGSYPICLRESISKFIKKHNLKDDNGNPLTLTISRFRPTLVSELLENYVSLREIQLMLGHSSIRTTITYLDSLDFNLISRTKLNVKITEIHQSTFKEDTEESSIAKAIKDPEVKVFFRTPFAECRNIFNPPDFVKNLSSYTPGNPCSQYNKCLSCDNVIITSQSLPQIFAMQRDYKHLLEHSLVAETPYAHVIFENLQMINSITSPELSDFSTEELKDAEKLSEYVENTCVIDGVV